TKITMNQYAKEKGFFPETVMRFDSWNVVMLGLESSLTFSDNISVNVGGGHSIYGGNGNFKRRDYSATSTSPVSQREGGSENRIITGDINVAGHLNRVRTFAFDGILGLRYQFWEWKDDTDSYKDSSSSQPASLDDKHTTTYDLSIIAPYLGMTIMFSWEYFQMKSWIAYSPINRMVGHEQDWLNDVSRYYIFENLQYLDIGLEVTGRFEERFFATFGIATQRILPGRGDVGDDSEDQLKKYPDIAEISQRMLFTTITVGFVF
ncbi:MAG: omptin family outer membrane protease, partial [Nanoarchaeota archaeon]